MINIKVGKQEAKLPSEWNELRLKDWVKMLTTLHKFDCLTPINEELSDEEKAIEDAERNIRYFQAIREIFSHLTKLSMDIVNQCEETEIATVISIMNNFLGEKKESGEMVEFFEHKGVKYFYPIQNMRKSTFEDFIEASQLDVLQQKKEAGRFGVIAEQMAILCREEGEVFDVDKIEKKSRRFLDLSMDKVWDFVFFLTKQMTTSRKSLLMYSRGR